MILSRIQVLEAEFRSFMSRKISLKSELIKFVCISQPMQNQEIEPEFFSREAEGLILYKVSKYHVIRSIWAHKNDEGVLSFKKRYN